MIEKTLERFGQEGDPSHYELQYRLPNSGSIARLFMERVHVLADDEAPVLVSEWYSDGVPRRWALYARTRTARAGTRSKLDRVTCACVRGHAHVGSACVRV